MTLVFATDSSEKIAELTNSNFGPKPFGLGVEFYQGRIGNKTNRIFSVETET